MGLWTKYRDASGFRPHPMRVNAWKRTSGRTMGRMREAGLLRWNHMTFGHTARRVYYDVTDAGFAAAGLERP